MIRPTRAFFVAGVLSLLTASAEGQPTPNAGDPIADELKKAMDECKSSIDAADERLLAAFEENRKRLQSNSRLPVNEVIKALDQLDKEKKAFQADITKLPESEVMKAAVSDFKTRMATAMKRCERVFDGVAERYRRKNDLAAAQAILEKKERFFKKAVRVLDSRRIWTFPTGNFTVQEDGGWLETKNDGKKFEFNETKRDSDVIELSSKNEKVIIKIYKDSAEIQRGDGPFKHFHKGSWNE